MEVALLSVIILDDVCVFLCLCNLCLYGGSRRTSHCMCSKMCPLMCRQFGIFQQRVCSIVYFAVLSHGTTQQACWVQTSVDSLMLPSPIPYSVVVIKGVLHSYHCRPPANEAALKALRSMTL